LPSGGSGKGADLGSQNAIVLGFQHKVLFAVNAGDNTISSFRVNTDGSLELLNTHASGGTMPVSLAIRNQILYVVNAVSSNINGFAVDLSGTFTHIPGSLKMLRQF